MGRVPRPAVSRSRLTLAGAHVLGVLCAALVDGVWRNASQRAFYGGPEKSLVPTMVYFLDLTVAAYVAVVLLKRIADTHEAVIRQERRQLTLRAELAGAQLSYLETQLQPHFLFNSLGAVLELAHESPATAARMIRQLAALLRFAVHGRGQTVTLAQELEALEPYLEIQRLRFADWLTISRDATAEALRVNVPRMTLQPIVENAIRHGLADRTERGHIAIVASLEDKELCLHVSARARRRAPSPASRCSGKLLDEGQAGENVGLLLRGTKREDVERGMVVIKPGTTTPHTNFDANVYILSKEEGGRHTPFFNNYRPQFYFRTTDVTGVVTLPEGTEMVMPGDQRGDVGRA